MTINFCPHCMADIPAQSAFCPACGKDVKTDLAEGQLPVGTVLVSPKQHRYLFGEVKGGGGFGRTYIGRELTSGKNVAIKEYYPIRCQPQRHPDMSLTPAPGAEELYERGKKSFISEASMLRAVNKYKYIVHIMEYFELNNTVYMVMEYLDGITLQNYMRTQKRFEPTMLFNKLIPLMRDIGRLHEAGVIHRDIAPDNIMLMPDGTMKLLDFGCARSMEDGKSMTVILKPGFAPIEQYQTRGQGPQTDVYSLAATIYYCLTGKTPVDAPTRLNVMVASGEPDPLPPPSEAGAAVSREIDDLMMWCLSMQPTSRLQSMEKAAEMFGEILARENNIPPQPQPDPDPPEPVPDPDPPGPTPAPDPPAPPDGGTWWEQNGKTVLACVGIAAAVIIIILLIALLAK